MEYKLNTKLIKEKMLEKGYSINKLAYIRRSINSKPNKSNQQTRLNKRINNQKTIRSLRNKNNRPNKITKGENYMYEQYTEEEKR